MTKFYLRAATAADPPSAGDKSAGMPNGTGVYNSGATFESLSLSTTAGTAQTSKALNSLGQTAHQDGYIARFTSEQLAAQTIAAQNWTFGWASTESHAAANAFHHPILYVWRPGTQAVVGYIMDTESNQIGTEWVTAETGRVPAAVSGSSVTAEAGDVLVYEFWFHAVQASTAVRTNTIYFDGTVEPTQAVATSDAASYVNSANTITFKEFPPTAILVMRPPTPISRPR